MPQVRERSPQADESWDLRVLRDAVEYQRWVLASFGPALRGRVLEVGAGNGNFTRWLPELADSVVALEPDEAMQRDLLELNLERVEVVGERFESFNTPAASFDCVLMTNVLEHIADERGTLEAARAVLRPDGKLCILVPAHRQLFGSLDQKYGHLRRYSRKELRERLRQCGFAVDTCRYINPVGAVGWLVATRFIKVGNLSKGSVRASERIAVPIGRLLDRHGVRFQFGQSVIAVASHDRN